MMKFRYLLVAGALAFPVLIGSAAYAHKEQLHDAIAHTREAVAAGRTNKPETLVRHATEALYHARAAQADHPNIHIRRGITRLKEAIKFGNKRRSAATTIANRALQELERAPQ